MKRHWHDDGRVHGVVCACQRDDGRWLVIRRSEHVAAPGQICFPGGGAEHGESHEDTAIREIREELGVEVELLQKVWHLVCPDRPLTLWGFHAKLVSQTITPDTHEVAEVLWLTRDEILSHPDMLLHTERFIEALDAAGVVD